MFAFTPATIPIKEYISTTTVAALQADELNVWTAVASIMMSI